MGFRPVPQVEGRMDGRDAPVGPPNTMRTGVALHASANHPSAVLVQVGVEVALTSAVSFTVEVPSTAHF